MMFTYRKIMDFYYNDHSQSENYFINPAELVLNYMKIGFFINYIFLVSAVFCLFCLYKAENISLMNYFLQNESLCE